MTNLYEMNMQECLVSIIIPVYNVEKYLEACVYSVLAQTYQNIEIILVDDGSEDSSGTIADTLKARDTRIRVIHQTNAGVSAARNRGMEMATGEYLMFVDGDDYIAADCVEYMLSLAEKTQAEFCLSKLCFTSKNEAQTEKENTEILSPADATALLLSPQVVVGCWNKIFKRSFITENHLSFSTNLFYGEGLSFITQAAQTARAVGVGNRKVYYYRRNNASSATSKFDIQKLYNGENALTQIGEALTITNPKVDTMLLLHKSLFCLGALTRIEANHAKREYRDTYNRWLHYIRRSIFKLLRSKEVSLYRKLMLLGGCISPRLMKNLDTLRRKRIVANSV